MLDAAGYNSACRYDALRIAFESRLANLANTVRLSIQHMSNNKVLRELNSTSITRKFAPDHARLLIKRHLAAERDSYFYHLALKLADAEGEASLHQRRNEDLASSLAAMRADVTLRERSDAKFTNVKTDIQELRRDYQVLSTKVLQLRGQNRLALRRQRAYYFCRAFRTA